VADYLAALVQAGMPHNGVTAGQANVLYFDWEIDADEFNERMLAVKAGIAGYPKNAGVAYRRCHCALTSDIAEIQRYVAERQAGLVVVDSLVAATDGDITDNALAT
jgi:hypothetical protein